MWCVAKLDEEYIARMEEVLELYERPLSAKSTGNADLSSFNRRGGSSAFGG